MGPEMLSTSAAQSVVQRSAVSASPGSLLEMHIPEHLQPTESKNVGMRPRYLCFYKLSRGFLMPYAPGMNYSFYS